MKPYIAILYDSLIESIQSRVLWILLAAWTLILVALFPLSLSEGESYRVRMGEITNAKTVLDQLAAASSGKGTRSQKLVYAAIDQEFQNSLRDRQKTGRRISVGRLVTALNTVMDKPDLYDRDAWPTAERRTELKELIQKENKSSDELQKLNRRLLDLAFPGSLRSSSGQATWITYAGMKFTDPLPFTLRQIRPFIEASLFPFIMWVGVGQIAMMIAIVITSSMIPDMFQTGSLHLLLSKPLSRSLLYLSKYLGGCIFVALNISFLIVGLYFYSGIQLGIWNQGILWCIPLFIFAFMVFYSVSALVGLIWKNPIICVVVTALFWGVCFTIGTVRSLSEAFLRGPPTLQRILAVGDTPIVANQQGRIQFWNDKDRVWQTGFGEVDGQRVIGPIWQAEESSLYFGRTRFIPFGLGGGETIRLELARIPELGKTPDAGPSSEVTGKKLWDDSRLDSAPDLPADTFDLIPWKNGFLAASTDGIYWFDAERAAKADQQKISVLGFEMKIPQANETYKRLTEADWGLRKPIAVGLSNSLDALVLVSRDKLIVLKSNDDKFEKLREMQLDIPAEAVVNLAVSDSLAIVCANAEIPVVVNLETMELVRELSEIGKANIKRTGVASDGRVALLSTDGDLWMLSPDSSEARVSVSKPSISGQGDISTIHFDPSNRLWVCHNVKQIEVHSPEMKPTGLSFYPKKTTPEWIYDYVINPFYLVNPKPAAINETIQYVLRNPENKVNVIDRTDLDIPQVQRDPWQPIWSNGIFILVMLALGCWQLYRQDL